MAVVTVREARDVVANFARLARANARWHRDRWRATGDRYHLGQWKAYHRTGLRLSDLEVFRVHRVRPA